MITGLPGTGIGGLFYLLLGLWMPFQEALDRFRGRSNPFRRRVVARQIVMAVGIIVGMGLIGALIGWLVALGGTMPMTLTADAAAPGGAVKLAVVNYLSLTMFAWVFIVLFGVLSSVHVLRLMVRVVAFVRREKSGPGSPFSSFPETTDNPLRIEDLRKPPQTAL